MRTFMVSLRDPANETEIIRPARYLLVENGAPTELTQDAWLAAVLASFPEHNTENLPRGDLLFFVHGFNVSAADALKGDVQNARYLDKQGWTGTYVSFDWPSLGETLGYRDDHSNARDSANELIKSALRLFVATLQPRCEVRVSIMAHSMGAFVVRQALSWAYQDAKTNSKTWSISQLLLVAADISQASLSASTEAGRWFAKYARRTTLYFNHFDNVLRISDVKNGEPTARAGRVGLPDDAPASFCSVDCSGLFDAVTSGLQDLDPARPHCFYFDNGAFWQDAVLTLEAGIDRNVIPNRQPEPTANRFALNPKPMTKAAYESALRLAQLSWP